MAASGGELERGSDGITECDIPCNNCARAKREITLYCYVCGIYCCDGCKHSCGTEEVLRITKESQICPVHGNQIICYYCPSHKELLCPVEEKSKRHRSVIFFSILYISFFQAVVLQYVMYPKLLKEYVSNIKFLIRSLEPINNTNLADVSSDKVQTYCAKAVHKSISVKCTAHGDVSQIFEF